MRHQLNQLFFELSKLSSPLGVELSELSFMSVVYLKTITINEASIKSIIFLIV